MAEETTGPEPEAQEQGGTNAEAAKYRRRLREVEAERGALAQQVSEWQRREVLRLASDHLVDADDLLTIGGAQVADLLDDTGQVDPGKVGESVTSLLAARPRLGLDYAGPVESFDGGVRGVGAAAPAPSWSQVLSGRSQ